MIVRATPRAGSMVVGTADGVEWCPEVREAIRLWSENPSSGDCHQRYDLNGAQ